MPLRETPEIGYGRKSANIIFEAQKVFVQDRLENNITFFDTLSPSDIFTDFKKYLNGKAKFKDLGLEVTGFNADQQNALVDQITEEKLKVIYVRKKNLKDLENIFNKEYKSINISDVTTELSKLPITKLVSLVKSEDKRKIFLKENGIFDNDEELLESKRFDEKNLLENIKISKSAYKKLSKEEKQRLFSIFNSYSKIDLADLDTIISTLKDEESKSNLVKYFFSRISVEDLDKHGLLTSDKKDTIINSISHTLSIPTDDAKDIYNSLDKSEIFLSTEDLSGVDFLNILSDNTIKKKIIDEYNSEMDISSDEETSLNLNPDYNGNINNAFINFVKNNQKISQNIRDKINLLQNGNFIEISSNSKERGVRKGYYHIKKVDNGNSVSTKNITLENITANNGAKKVGNGFEELFTYHKFYEFLEKASVSDEKNNISVDFKAPEEFKNSGISQGVDNSGDINSYEDLLVGLDSIDSDGKNFGFTEKGTAILDKEEGFVFLINKIDKSNKTIVVDEGKGTRKITFQEFFSVFKNSGKLKRIKKINTFSEIKAGMAGNANLSALELTGKGLINKSNDKEGKNPIKYLIGDSKEGIHIKSISENGIEYTLGDIKKEKSGNKEVKKFKGKYKSANYSQFLEDINNYKLRPEINQNIEDEKEKSQKMESSFMKKFLSGLSITEIISSFEFVIDGIKKKLERGNRLKALNFAQKYSGVLGKEMQNSLKSMAEQEEKNLSEEIMSELKTLGSGPMIEQIRRIITNKNSELYEIIACLMTVTSKYGVLYPKGMKDMAGSLHWYKILGGTKEFEVKHRQKLASGKSATGKPEPINFTEESLVEAWLKKLAGEGKLRSKIDKDFGNNLNTGRNEEMEDGKNKVGDQITNDGKNDYFVGELENRTYANGIGGLEKIFAKNSTPQDMHAAPFILAVSGYGKNLDQVLTKHLQGLAFSTPYASLLYGSTEEGNIKYVNFIKALMKNAYPQDSKMRSDFDKIFKANSEKNNSIPREAYKFWKNHGGKLVNYINLEDPLIIFKKDSVSEFKEYYETLKGTFTDNEYTMKDEDIGAGVFLKNSVALAGGGLSKIKSDSTGGLGGPISKTVYKMYLDSFEDIKKSSSGNIEDKRKAFLETFPPFEKHIRESIGFFVDKNLDNTPIVSELRKRGLDIAIGVSDFEYDSFLNRVFNNFMGTTSPLSNAKNDTKYSIDEIIHKAS